jgi:sugar/nucleoside kinase (ribokinase family)
MSAHAARPVICFSYLAAAELWRVPRFPLANYGAEVLSIEHSVAADAPMVAAVLTALDIPTVLLANDLGDDTSGAKVRTWLQRHGVMTRVNVAAGVPTPRVVIVADDEQTRTWFAYLPVVADSLATVDLSAMLGASFAYIDCYQLITASAVRAIHAAQAVGIPLLLNLGGSPLASAVAAAVRGYPRLVVQTNVKDAAYASASHTAESILTATDADWAVVTAGAYGAVALSQAEHLSVPAFRVVARHTHCAGAAFSGGLLYGLLHDWPMNESLCLGCASGALRCERTHNKPLPTLEELRAVTGSRVRTLTNFYTS